MAVTEITKEGKVFYKVQVARTDESGKRFQRKRYVKTLKQAYVSEAELIKELEEVITGKRAVTWKELVDEYFVWACRLKAPTTIDRERYSLRAHINPYFNDKLVSQIKPAEVDALIFDNLKDKTKSTQKCVLRYLSGVFNFAVEKCYCENNPCRGKSRLIKIEEKLKPTLDREQVHLLLERAKECGVEWYPVWFLGVHCGARNGELIAIRWKAVDLKRNILTIAESWTSRAGFHSTKSREVRQIPINPALREFLIELKEQTTPESEEAFVLPRIPTWMKGNQSRELRIFCKAIGLPPIHFHSLRSIFISQLLLNNTPLPICMKINGHKQLATVLRYIKLTGKEIEGATDCLDFGSKKKVTGAV